MSIPIAKIFEIPYANILYLLYVYNISEYTMADLLNRLPIPSHELIKCLNYLLDVEFMKRYKKSGVWFYTLNWKTKGVYELAEYFRVTGATYYKGQPKTQIPTIS